jgi:LPS-assembly protein
MRKGVNGWAMRVAAVGLGTASLMLAAMPTAQAQQKSPHRGSSSTDAQGNPVPVLFSADDVNYDDQLGITTARGNVEITQGGRTLLADVVSYNERTDTVTASGHVTILQETGETVFANYVELTDEMRDGFIKDVRMLLADRSRLVGNTGRRTDGNRLELRKGIYSPCDLCKDDPDAPPLWQLRADTVIHNKAEQLVEYKDVVLDIYGFPVLYSPYMSHPDPSVKRQSGFLPPTLGESTTLGAIAKIPYYYVIGPDKDFTFAPMFTSMQGIVIDGEYNQRFSNGNIYFQASATQGNLGNGSTLDSTSTTANHLRGNINSIGTFDLTDEIRAGFNIRRVTDQTYLEVYKFGSSEPFLTSRGYLEDFQGRNYGVVNAYAFQSLQFGVTDRTQPIVLPSAQYTWAGAPTTWGGRFTTTVDAIDLLRETGSASRRTSLGTEFDLPFSGLGGQRFNFVAGIRGDGYNVSGVQVGPNGREASGSTGRLFPQIGLEWSYPWVSRGTSTFLIEPRAAVYAAPVGLNPSKIPNDDSQAVDFNETDLFTRNRAQGYDQVDSGQRVDYGLQGAWYSDSGPNAQFLVGQSIRFQNSSPFAVNGIGDGLQRPTSDYVGKFQFTPINSVDFTYRARLDERDLRPQRQEVSTSFGPPDIRISTSFLQLGNNIRDDETHREQIGLGLNLKLNQYWSASASGSRDLAGDGILVSSAAAAQYTDECLTFIASVTQTGVRNRDIRPGTTVLFQLVFKNIGEIGLPAVQLTPSSS